MHACTYISKINGTAATTYLTNDTFAADIRYNASMADCRRTTCYAT